ncbi:hypothetical protein KEM52_001465 [Ascosphaera acerosa]|nr:hypothetical protein KEM52_001465 [Ascosphaera acerosa]
MTAGNNLEMGLALEASRVEAAEEEEERRQRRAREEGSGLGSGASPGPASGSAAGSDLVKALQLSKGEENLRQRKLVKSNATALFATILDGSAPVSQPHPSPSCHS